MASKKKRVRTYQWGKLGQHSKRLSKHGFRHRNETKAGKNILTARRRKGRKRLAVQRTP
jgi:ribosomal protein L34